MQLCEQHSEQHDDTVADFRHPLFARRGGERRGDRGAPAQRHGTGKRGAASGSRGPPMPIGFSDDDDPPDVMAAAFKPRTAAPASSRSTPGSYSSSRAGHTLPLQGEANADNEWQRFGSPHTVLSVQGTPVYPFNTQFPLSLGAKPNAQGPPLPHRHRLPYQTHTPTHRPTAGSLSVGGSGEYTPQRSQGQALSHPEPPHFFGGLSELSDAHGTTPDHAGPPTALQDSALETPGHCPSGMEAFGYFEGSNPAYGPGSITSSAYGSPTLEDEPQDFMYQREGVVLFTPEAVQTVETLQQLEGICSDLLYESQSETHTTTVALDLEGRDLGRHGTLCVITMATLECIYLIDMVKLGGDVLVSSQSLLRAVLESPHIRKLMFDCRGDAEALYFGFNVRLENVCDLQVSSCCSLCRSAKHLPSMKTVLTRLALLQKAEKEIKDRGRDFFNPDRGGSYDAWERRPLHPLLIEYCAVDVKHFFNAYQLLENYAEYAMIVSAERIDKVCRGMFSNEMSLRDFRIPDL